MKALRLHRWNVTPREASRIQLRLRTRFEPADRLGPVERIAGADVALDEARQVAVAGVIAYKFPEMEEIERVWAQHRLTFPYVPGLLSFREIPVLLRAFRKLACGVDVIFCDGHGYAHPRRFGIASHLGVLLDCPTIGCAKSILVGEPREPALSAGSWAPLVDRDETIAAVLRTRERTNPVYISQGHRISLSTAIELTRAVIDGFRVPRPTRDADHFVGEVKRMLQGGQRSGQSMGRKIKTGGEKPGGCSTSRGGWGDCRKDSAG
ncbi:MAG TPA: deoxyribonuclease V [Candidatus Cybelea sp.]|nr:deoxyribonuclease V [Candidatus Cybelea sp.]